METPEEKFVESLLNEYSLPNDAKVGETPLSYHARKEREQEQKSKDTNKSKTTEL